MSRRYTLIALVVLCACSRQKKEKLPEYVKDAGDSVLETLDREIPLLTQCYDQRAVDRPDLKGTWTLSLVVQRDGTVDEVKVTGPTKDEPLETCLANRVDRWIFAPLPIKVPVFRKVSYRP